MSSMWLVDHACVMIFVVAGILASTLPFAVAALFAPRTLSRQTLDTYECGMDPIGPAWVRYGVLYYLYALMFLAFDVDVLYLFPAVLAYRDIPGWAVMWEVLLFIAILGLAIAFAWKKGVFTWSRRIEHP